MKDKTAFGMSFEEFCKFDKEYEYSENNPFKDAPIREENESLLIFLKAGSKSLKKNPTICGKLS